jgi:predicted small lipoprotein YifL
MKILFCSLLILSVFTGCGYKADPVYVNDTKKETYVGNK